jgi:hypothetical protein
MEEMEVESNLVPSSFSAERLALVEDIDKVRPHFSVGATTKCRKDVWLLLDSRVQP